MRAIYDIHSVIYRALFKIVLCHPRERMKFKLLRERSRQLLRYFLDIQAS